MLGIFYHPIHRPDRGGCPADLRLVVCEECAHAVAAAYSGAPLIGGIFVFRQKNETYRDWLVVTLIVITAVMVLANCTMPTQRLWLLTIQGDLGLVLNSDWLSKFFMVLAVCIWAPVVVFTKPYIRHAGQGNQFMGFCTMTLGVLMGLAQAANFVTMYMFFEMMSLITVPLVLHNATPAARRAGFKYLGYSVFGAGMALAGYFFIAYYLTVPDFQPGGAIDFSRAAEHQPLLLVAYCLMIVGFGAKAGMMPMQSWLPAAHPVAPAPASAVLSGVITKGWRGGCDPGYLLYVWTGVSGGQLAPVCAADADAGHGVRGVHVGLSGKAAEAAAGLFHGEPGVLCAVRPDAADAGWRPGLSSADGLPCPGQGYALPGGGRHHLLHQLHPGGSTAGHRPADAGNHVVLHPGGPSPLIGIPPMAGFVSKWYLLTASLEAPIQAFGVAGLVVLVVSALLTAGYLLPVVTEGFFPGGVFSGGGGRGVQMTWPMIAFAAAVVLMGLLPGGLLHWLGLSGDRFGCIYKQIQKLYNRY